jgi:hypothetical protein
MQPLKKGNMLAVNHIRSLKGAPLSVYCVMLSAGRPVTQEFCARHSGYTDKPVRQALRLLEELGYISHDERTAWQITPEAAQLLSMAEIPPQAASSGNNSDSMGTATATIVESSIMGSINAAEAAKNDEPEKFRVDKNMKALRKAGIYGSKAQEIACLPYVTPRYIKAHAAYAERRKDAPGLLIRRMCDGDPAPKLPPAAGDDRHKYIEGKYAAFIEH